MPQEPQTVSEIQIHTGIHITRRKNLNVVTDGEGEPIWTGGSIFKACRWCLDNEYKVVSLHLEGEVLRLLIEEADD